MTQIYIKSVGVIYDDDTDTYIDEKTRKIIEVSDINKRFENNCKKERNAKKEKK
jgi:hypothetical protein